MPSTSAGAVAWMGRGDPVDGSPDEEVYFWDGATTEQLTQDDRYQYYPQLSSGRIVWREDAPAEYALVLWEKGVTTVIGTSGSGDDHRMWRVSPDWVVWSGGQADYSAIYRFDGTVEKISPAALAADFPALSGTRLLFVGTSDDSRALTGYQVYFYDGSSALQITQNDHVKQRPTLREQRLVWEEWTSGKTTARVVSQLVGGSPEVISDTSFSCGGPSTDGDSVAWSCFDADGEIDVFVQNASGDVARLSTSGQDSSPQIDRGVVAWEHFTSSDGGEILVWDGDEQTVIAPFTHNPGSALLNQQLAYADGRIVWVSYDGQHDQLWTAELTFCP